MKMPGFFVLNLNLGQTNDFKSNTIANNVLQSVHCNQFSHLTFRAFFSTWKNVFFRWFVGNSKHFDRKTITGEFDVFFSL